MFKLNLKIALRNLWRNKTSSLLNICGLAIGLASCLLLLLYVSYEWGYDKQGKDSANVYQVLVNSTGINGENQGTGRQTPGILGPVMKQNYAGISAMIRTGEPEAQLIANGTKGFKRQGRYADADILKIFEYNFISGDPKTALSSPGNVIVTESTARALFGTADVLNKSVRFDNKYNLKVTGVIKDLPGNTSFGFDYLMPWTLFESISSWVKLPNWTNNSWTTLVKLDPTVKVESINQSIKGLIKRNEADTRSSAFLFPLSKLHLYDTFINGVSTGGRIEQLRLFMGLAIGILLIACVNFMNMATAKSEKRAKEVGIKKTIGATKTSLITQFLLESLILTFCSALMAIALIELCLPLFNNVLAIELTISYSNPYVWLSIFAVVILTGLIAGSYPAFYLSAFNPVQILKKRSFKRGLLAVNLRHILVVIQFSFAVILIIATGIIYKQIQFIKNRPAGYQVNELVELQQEGNLIGKFELLKDKLLQSGAAKSVSQLSGSMSNSNSNFWGLEWEDATEAGRHEIFSQLCTTYDFVKTTGVKLLEGRDFSSHLASDTSAVMLSQTAIKRMNLSNPIGKIVKYQGQDCKIIGVFEDFIWASPFKANLPMIVAFNKRMGGYVSIRLNQANSSSANISTIERVVKEINPAYPVEISFVDQLYGEKLKSQKILGILSNLFGGLAIFISCLGLFGLASYSAELRTKEIGVRKVLGASVFNLIQLLSMSFLKMVLVAIVIAVPIANYMMSNWLKGFEFHTSISWVIIVLAAAGTLGIALFTVSFQAFKAAKTNPVQALKYQ
ncbi:ABC transporter permease [Pedobacter sp. PAMC26386]|nr:ABC transporter permease [Pedobacter sp. PAMC26386]